MSPITEYEQRVASGALKNDPNQREALEMLDYLHKDLINFKPSKLGYLKGFFSGNRRPPKGIYIYGGVGRGKSRLMDCGMVTSPMVGAKLCKPVRSCVIAVL